MLRYTIALCMLAVLAALYSIQPVQTQANRSTPAVLYEGARLISWRWQRADRGLGISCRNGTITKVGGKGK